MQAEKIIKASPSSLAYELIPTPRSISSNCGFSLSMPVAAGSSLVHPAACYFFNEKESTYEKIS
jgi:hypothetical protein